MNQTWIACRGFDDAVLGRVRRGDIVDGISEARRRSLEGNGLIVPDNKMAAAAQNQMRPAPLGKVSTAGRDQPSSASPAGQASPQTTASLFGPGVSPAKRTRKSKAGESSSSTPASN